VSSKRASKILPIELFFIEMISRRERLAALIEMALSRQLGGDRP